MSKKTIIKGTLILTLTGIATKLLGFYNRIFLTRLIGVKELGIYQLIFPIYMLAFSFCCQGIATSLTKQVSYYIGRKRKKDTKNIFKLALFSSFLLSIITFFIVNFFSYQISKYLLKNTDCHELLQIISLAIPFISVKGCINSYFVGMDMPQYQGMSHFIEQIIRIGSTYILSCLWVSDTITAKVAVIAVVTGEISVSLLSVYWYHRYTKKCNKHPKHEKSKISSELIRHFFKDAVPITSTGLMLTIFSSLESIILPSMLFKYYLSSDTALEIYGIITGIVIPFLLLPSTITTSLSTMLLPAVSYANAQQSTLKIKKTIQYSVTFCFVLGLATCAGYLLLGKWICIFAFKSETAGAFLEKMCYLCPLIYISGNMSAILNGLDKAFLNLMFNVSSIAIRIIFTFTLVPHFGIKAYIGGMTLSYLVLNLFLGLTVYKYNFKETSQER